MRWEFDDYVLDDQLLELRRAGCQVHVPPLPLRFLIHLARNSLRAVPAEELRSVVWRDVAVTETSLRQLVRTLRHALGDESAKRIVSVRGFGYRFEGALRQVPESSSVVGPERGEDSGLEAPALRGAERTFVGRQAELGALLRAAELARGGKGQVVLVCGRPGLGKTRLAEELCVRLRPAMRVVWGRCWEDGGSPPFWPWDEVRRGILADDRQSELEQAALLLDGTRPREPAGFPLGSQDPHARFQLFEVFAALVRQKSEGAPLLIVLDDLHAADEPALLLLAFLARELPRSKTLLLGTFREEELRRRERCAAIVDRVASMASTLVLSGLDSDSIRACIEEGTRRTVADASVTRLQEITGGNPLFLHELIRIYGEELAEGIPSLSDVAPASGPLRDAIRRHVRPLSTSAREFLCAAAVVGTEVDLGVLGEMLGWSSPELASAADEARAAGLVHAVGPARLRFDHMLVRELLREELDAVQRRGLHRRAADALERLGHAGQAAAGQVASAAAVAYHLVACLPDPDAAHRAVDCLSSAAAAASAGMAHEEARRYQRSALGLLQQMGPPDARWFELSVRLVDAERLCGAFDEARSAALGAVAWARARGTPEQLAEAVWACARAHPETGEVDHALMAMLEEALARLPARASWLRVILSARFAVLLSFSEDSRSGSSRCGELSEQALAGARELGDLRAVGYALSARIFCLIGVPTAPARRLLAEAVDEALAVTRICNDPDITLELLAWGHVAMLNRGLVERAREELLRFEQLCRVAQRPLHDWHLRSIRAARAIWEGAFVQGEALAAEAFEFGKRMQAPYAIGCYGAQVFQIRRDQGRLKELVPLLRAHVEAFPTMAVWRAGLAVAYAESDDDASARAELERVADRDLSNLKYDLNLFPLVTLLASVSVRLDDQPRCARLYALIEQLEAGLVPAGAVTAALGVRDESLGQLMLAAGNAERAAEHFRAALRFTQRLGALPWTARAQLGLVRALLLSRSNTGARDEAIALARQARELTRRLGMALVAAQLDMILAEAPLH